ncbi:MAG TPA: hypothetical protein VGK79_14030 [Gaiellaceae bacterium]|jgi:hypothetical protein
MTTRWVAPLGEQLRFLADWLEPVLTRPGLTRVPVEELRIEIGEAETVPEFEPFDALVGPVRADAQGIVADVIPVEAFDALIPGAAPLVVFARRLEATAAEPEPLEFVASEAVVVTTVVPA